MRKTVKILGVGNRREGVGKKSGKPYVCQEISLAYQLPNYTGHKCEAVTLYDDVLADHAFKPGDEVDVEMISFNFQTRILHIYA